MTKEKTSNKTLIHFDYGTAKSCDLWNLGNVSGVEWTTEQARIWSNVTSHMSEIVRRRVPGLVVTNHESESDWLSPSLQE